MKWNEEDTKLLKSWGYSDNDIEQVKLARKYLKLEKYTFNGDKTTKITIDEAIEILGRETFLSGLSRASFHYTSERANNEIHIYFDCSKMFI